VMTLGVLTMWILGLTLVLMCLHPLAVLTMWFLGLTWRWNSNSSNSLDNESSSTLFTPSSTK